MNAIHRKVELINQNVKKLLGAMDLLSAIGWSIHSNQEVLLRCPKQILFDYST